MLGILFLLTLDSLDGFGGLRYSGHLLSSNMLTAPITSSDSGRSIATSSIAMDTSRLFLVKQSTDCDCNCDCEVIGKNDFIAAKLTHRRRLLLAWSLLVHNAYSVPITTAPAFAESTSSSSSISIPKECQNGALVAGKK